MSDDREGSAFGFAIDDDIEWDTPAAPAPASAPVPAAAPAAPMSPPPASAAPAPPAPAAGAGTPAVPTGATPARQSSLPLAAPAAPFSDAAPAARPGPLAPAPAPGPAPTPAPAAPTPAATPAPLTAQPATPSEPAAQPAAHHEPVGYRTLDAGDPETLSPPEPAPHPLPGPQPDEARTKRRRRGEASPASRRAASVAGGRWQVKVLRATFYTVGALLLVVGLRNTLFPAQPPSLDQIVAEVNAVNGESGFPTTAAEAFAIRFANTYLTVDPENPEARTRALSVYAPAAAAGAWPVEATEPQQILSGPYVSKLTRTRTPEYGAVTVTSQITGGIWVTMEIPIYASRTGALVIAGSPAFVANPPLAVHPAAPGVADPDAALAVALRPALEAFFAAWATSDRDTIALYTTPDATPAAQIGLGQAARLVSVDDIRYPASSDAEIEGLVAVTWGAGTAQFQQTYRVLARSTAEGKWLVADINGGVLTDTVGTIPEDVPNLVVDPDALG